MDAVISIIIIITDLSTLVGGKIIPQGTLVAWPYIYLTVNKIGSSCQTYFKELNTPVTVPLCHVAAADSVKEYAS
jgi:hypothetical protein